MWFSQSRNIKIFKICHSSEANKRYTLFKEIFPEVDITEKHFTQKSRDFINFIRKKKWHGETREAYEKFFSRKKWQKLCDDTKSKHTLKSCNECLKNYSEQHNKFPTVTGHKIKAKGKKKILNQENAVWFQCVRKS